MYHDFQRWVLGICLSLSPSFRFSRLAFAGLSGFERLEPTFLSDITDGTPELCLEVCFC